MSRLLIVVDMQNDFVTGSLGSNMAQDIVPHVTQKVTEAVQKGETVVFTRDTHEEDYLTTQEGKKLPVKHCIKGTDGWQILECLRPYAKIIFDKPTFGSILLAEYVKKNQFEEIELIGLCTDICVISNALLVKAYVPEANVRVDATCCAGVTEQSHQNALQAMEMCHVQIQA